MTEKEEKALIEARLQLSLIKFYQSLPYMVKKLFWKQAMAYYNKGRDDVYKDWKWLNKEWTKK